MNNEVFYLIICFFFLYEGTAESVQSVPSF